MPDEAEFEFIVERRPDGGLSAHSSGACVVVEADDIEELRREVRDAVCCHFDERCRPARIRLRFVEVVREETLEP